MWFKKKPNVEPKAVPTEAVPLEPAEQAEPLEAVANIKYNPNISERMTRRNRFPMFANVPEHVSSGKVWVYNVSAMDFEVDNPVLKTVKIPGKTPEEKYAVYTSFPMQMKLSRENVDTEEVQFVFQDGRRFAMDLIFPDNLGLDQSAYIMKRTSVGRHLGECGVFWSLHSPPLEEELKAAKQRMLKRYRFLLEQVGTKIFVSGMTFNEKVKALIKHYKEKKKKAADNYTRSLSLTAIKLMAENTVNCGFGITPEHHAAAEYYKLKTEWHPVLEPRLRRTQKCQ
jgi:hypothetical protein